MLNYLENELLCNEKAGGGYEAMARVEPFVRIMPNIMSLLTGDPMIAAVALIVFDATQRLQPGIASRTLAQRIITERMTIEHRRIGRERQIRAWHRWEQLLPLWAGVLVEAGPWDAHNLVDQYRVPQAMLAVIVDDWRRFRALEYASWFVEIATSRAHQRASLPYLIRPDQVSRIGFEYPPEEPPPMPFLGELLAHWEKT
jgi:hypothetical protein